MPFSDNKKITGNSKHPVSFLKYHEDHFYLDVIYRKVWKQKVKFKATELKLDILLNVLLLWVDCPLILCVSLLTLSFSVSTL